MKLPDFESPPGEFSMSKIIRIFLEKIFIEEYQFRSTFFVKSIFADFNFKTTLFTKIFDKLSPVEDPKFGNFI